MLVDEPVIINSRCSLQVMTEQRLGCLRTIAQTHIRTSLARLEVTTAVPIRLDALSANPSAEVTDFVAEIDAGRFAVLEMATVDIGVGLAAKVQSCSTGSR